MSTTAVMLQVPSYVNLSQFTDVQRGTIFMWFITLLIICVINGVRLVMGQIDPDTKYEEEGKGATNAHEVSQSQQAFAKAVIKAQQINKQDDSGSVKVMKKVTRFSTLLLPLSITFALGFVMGATYAFSLVLYFLILLPLVLFNLLEFHKWVFEHKVFICIFDNIWIISTFFWLINIWVTKSYEQPYYLKESTL